mmetsp:Transcript_2077/g.6177  ORF Transcript_2077/g.6177 Transcript_2077/m.6177 type:complete len:265 (-) Transcript_2077:637-1431(-)
MGVTSFKHGHRYYGRVQRGGLARDERLQRQYDGAAGNHRVLCLVRHRSVASLAVDHNLEGSCPGHQRANSACHLPRVQPGPDVHGKHCINPFHDTCKRRLLSFDLSFLPRPLLPQLLLQACRSEYQRMPRHTEDPAIHLITFVHHQLTTGAAFLRWLEQKLHSPLELLLSRLQQICRSEQHRHVSIVSAGMHVAVILCPGFKAGASTTSWMSALTTGSPHRGQDGNGRPAAGCVSIGWLYKATWISWAWGTGKLPRTHVRVSRV